MNTKPARGLEIVGRSSAARPECLPTGREAAYRRLATVIMRLDVATLGEELRTARLGISLPRAA